MNGGPGKYGIGTKPTILGRWDGWRAEEGGRGRRGRGVGLCDATRYPEPGVDAYGNLIPEASSPMNHCALLPLFNPFLRLA